MKLVFEQDEILLMVRHYLVTLSVYRPQVAGDIRLHLC